MIEEEHKNILFDSYIKAKVQENEDIIKNWAHSMWLHYCAFLKEGFSEEQSMYLLGLYWERVDAYHRQKRLDEKNG